MNLFAQAKDVLQRITADPEAPSSRGGNHKTQAAKARNELDEFLRQPVAAPIGGKSGGGGESGFGGRSGFGGGSGLAGAGGGWLAGRRLLGHASPGFGQYQCPHHDDCGPLRGLYACRGSLKVGGLC